jgi:hypothetical protein
MASASTYDMMNGKRRKTNSDGATIDVDGQQNSGGGTGSETGTFQQVECDDISADDFPDASTNVLVVAWLFHVWDVICCRNRGAYDYLLSWLASVIQKHWLKLGAIPILKGEIGLGKGVFIKPLRAILGRMFVTAFSASDVAGKSNALLETATFLLLNATVIGSDPKTAQSIKALAAAGKQRERKMRVNTHHFKSHLNMMCFFNESDPYPAGDKDRRPFVLNCDTKWAGADRACWKEKAEYMDVLCKVEPKAVAAFLYERNICDFNSFSIPETNSLGKTPT